MMNKSYFQDDVFGSVDFNENPVKKGEYDNCTFENCIFSGFNLSDFSFEECVFRNCDFSNAKITNTAFKTVRFENCKLIGLQFDECNPFLLAFQFIGCHMNLSSFYKLKMKNTLYEECILHEVDFTESELAGSIFNNCDMSGAMFGNTILEKVDFRTSFHISINPELNNIRKAMFSSQNISGLLDKYDIIIEN